MTIEAELPDGTILEFPDDTPDDVIQGVVRQQLGAAQQAPGAAQLEPDFLGAAVIEPLKTIGTGLAAAVGGGLAGIGAAISPFAAPGAGARVVESAQELVSQPKTAAGQAGLENIGAAVQFVVDQFNIPASGIAAIVELVTGQGLDQAVKTLESVRERGLGVTAGERILEETGSPLAATVARVAPEAAVELLALKGGGAAISAARPALTSAAEISTGIAKSAADVTGGVFKFQSATKRGIAQLLERGSTDIETARFRLEPGKPRPEDAPEPSKLEQFLNIGGPRAVRDVPAIETIKQGFDEGVVAAIKGSSDADKAKLTRMVDIVERGKKNKLFAQTNRATDVAGDSLLERFQVVRSVNRQAGRELDGVAKALKGEAIDITSVVDGFVNELDSLGVSLRPDLTPDFRGSIIEGLTGPEAAIKRIVKRMVKTRTPDAFDVHRLKKFIDEQVTFGKTAEGLTGRTEIVLKGLRRNLDELLDSNFSEYDRVNTIFAETRGALDSLQDVAGKKLNLTGVSADKATGTLLRRLMSNAQSRVNLLDSVNELDTLAKKFSGPGKEVVPFLKNLIGDPKAVPLKKVFDDDLLTQVLFADELDRVFGAVARTSLKGQFEQAIPRTKADIAFRVAEKGIQKARGINDPAAFKAIKRLLRD